MKSDTATYGIDLASQPSRTGVCWITWHPDGSAWADCPCVGGEDGDLLHQMLRDDVVRVGIDAPFGWPNEFVDSLDQYRQTGTWDGRPLGDYSFDDRLRWRKTDRVIHELTGLSPLSVSTDKIGAVAMRCARLLDAYWQRQAAPPDRSGVGKAVEVYPAAALRAWGISPLDHSEDPGAYKGKHPVARSRREKLVADVVERTSGWLDLSEKARHECQKHDDCVDALLCALIARAAHVGHVREIDDPTIATTEGWIALPNRDLRDLGPAAELV